MRPGEYYLYVIDDQGYVRIAPANPPGAPPTKHSQVSFGTDAFGAGEVMMDSANRLRINDASGRYKPMWDNISQIAVKAFQALGHAVQSTNLPANPNG